jgi:hypothetical protein
MGLGGLGGSSHHGLGGVHHGGDPRDFGADDFPALSSPNSQHAAQAQGGRSIGSLDLSSLHSMAQSSGYMGGDENGYEYHGGEHSRTFPGHASSVNRSGRAPPPGGLSRSSAPSSIMGSGSSSNGLAGALPGSSSSVTGGSTGMGGIGLGGAPTSSSSSSSSSSASRSSRTSSTRPTRSSTAV